MIHRFVDSVQAAAPIVPLMVTKGSPTNTTNVYVVGDGMTPFQAVSKTAPSSDLGDPRLSPDETKIVYSYVTGGTPKGEIRVGLADGSSDSLVRGNIGAFTTAVTLSPAWSPDGSQIAFIEPPAIFGGNWTVSKMNADGTGYTTLYTIAGAAGKTIKGLSWSPSGSYLAALEWLLPSTAGKIHVIATDGSGGAVRYTSGTSVGDALSPPAWKRGSDVLGFCDQQASTFLWKTCNPDGTGLATIYNDTAKVYGGCERLSWLSDDSALVALKTISGPNVELSRIDAGGGGPADSGIDCGSATFVTKRPFVMSTSGKAPRIYFMTADGSNVRTLSSVLEDFSDQRIDWDGADYPTPPTQHHGIFEYDVN